MINVKKQKGLSLIELMVSLAITGFVMAGVVNTLLASKQTYIYGDQVAFIQDNARFALDTLTKNIRSAGYMGGCNASGADVANTVQNTTAQNAFLNSTLPVEGYEGGVDTFPSQFSGNIWSSTTSPDAIVFRKLADGNGVVVTGAHPPTSSNVLVTDSSSFKSGDIVTLVSADCRQVGIFAATQPPGGGPGTMVQHNTGSTGSSNNCTKKLTGNFDCSSVSAGSFTYPAGSSVHKMEASAYYIGPSSYDGSIPSLYVEGIGSGGAITKEELVAGVENMQITYGVDTTDTSGAPPYPTAGLANQYFTADQIRALADASGKATAGGGWVGWDKVVSVRIELLMRARDELLTVTDGTYGDKYLRQKVYSTIRIRNAVLPGNS